MSLQPKSGAVIEGVGVPSDGDNYKVNPKSLMKQSSTPVMRGSSKLVM